MSLFDKVPERIFRPLAAINRRFYADLLLHLYEHTFAAIGDTPRRVDVLAEIGDFLDRHTSEHGPLGDEDTEIEQTRQRAAEREAETSGARDVRRYLIFQYLVESGWLIEMRDRFRRMVDLSPEGRLLLREIQKIVQGDTRSYGGAVLNVLGSLDQAVSAPDERSEAIRNAWSFSRDFSHHLRSLAAQMRRVEEHVLAQPDLRTLFAAFFDEFVAKMLITDFKTLKTRNNPFRFRHRILERVGDIDGDPLLMARLADAYVRENRAADRDGAEKAIRDELQDIYRLFDNIDRHLDIIGDTQMRIERKIHTIVRYMDRHDGGAVERVTRAIRALGATGADHSAEIRADPHLLGLSPLLGGDLLYMPKAPRTDIARSRVAEEPPDPAYAALREAKLDYARRVAVSPQKIRDFLDRVFDGRDSVTAADILVASVDDFFVFQRLRELPFMFDGILARDYLVTPSGGRAGNEWLDYPDFTVTRVRKGI
jgi:hypothetical protein